jgi:hypothetical protein
MSKATTGEAEVLRPHQTTQNQMRRRIREAIVAALGKDVTETLGQCRIRKAPRLLLLTEHLSKSVPSDLFSVG